MINFLISPGQTVNGSIQMPGDKSISHRAAIFSALAKGNSVIRGFLTGHDTINTLNAMKKLGVDIAIDNDTVFVKSPGFQELSLSNQNKTIECDLGNSGTGIRLLAGLFSGLNIKAVLKGDESLHSRPMNRIIKPLRQMGANIDSNDGHAPLNILRRQNLEGIHYELPVASAQIKSAIMLAGLFASSPTTIIEPAPSRDHTERMLKSLACDINIDKNLIELHPVQELDAKEFLIPGDLSSAFFFIVSACIASNAELTIKNVGVNPTRTGALQILKAMGANIELSNTQFFGNEPVADIKVSSSKLTGIDIPPEWVPLAIDEFPIIAIAAACAKGKTKITGAHELRVKESDRISAMADGLNRCGIQVTEFSDGMEITGGSIQGGIVNSHSDHRIAMSFAIASLAAESDIEIINCDNVATSFPNFIQQANELGLTIHAS